MIEAHLMKLRARDEVSAEEEEAIRGLFAKVIDVQADQTVVRHSADLHNSTLLLSGWLARAKDLAGGQRQLTQLHVPGDFVDLHGFTLKRLDHDVVSLTRCRLALAPHQAVLDVTQRFPHLGRLFWLMTNIDCAIQREWTLSLGLRSAIARLAQLFCELNVRKAVVGLSQQDSYDLPLTQVELGQTLGLTSVHVNRTLQELRRRGLITLEGGRLTIHDLDELKRIAEFDGQYLYLEKRPR